ncbi:MAG: hypothetical protein U5N58_12140 [Actinomycetota bacterium]|nr:hypothetical protein [Actinomycetota bacterium]
METITSIKQAKKITEELRHKGNSHRFCTHHGLSSPGTFKPYGKGG